MNQPVSKSGAPSQEGAPLSVIARAKHRTDDARRRSGYGSAGFRKMVQMRGDIAKFSHPYEIENCAHRRFVGSFHSQIMLLRGKTPFGTLVQAPKPGAFCYTRQFGLAEMSAPNRSGRPQNSLPAKGCRKRFQWECFHSAEARAPERTVTGRVGAGSSLRFAYYFCDCGRRPRVPGLCDRSSCSGNGRPLRADRPAGLPSRPGPPDLDCPSGIGRYCRP